MSLKYEPASESLHISVKWRRRRGWLRGTSRRSKRASRCRFFFFFFTLVTGPRRSLSLEAEWYKSLRASHTRRVAEEVEEVRVEEAARVAGGNVEALRARISLQVLTRKPKP